MIQVYFVFNKFIVYYVYMNCFKMFFYQTGFFLEIFQQLKKLAILGFWYLVDGFNDFFFCRHDLSPSIF